MVLDPKGELFKHTSKWRQTLGPVYVINPFGVDDPDMDLGSFTHAINPIEAVKTHDDAWKLASAIYPPKESENQVFFDKEALNCIAAMISQMAEENRDPDTGSESPNIGDMRDISARADSLFRETIEGMALSQNPGIANAARTVLNTLDEERKNITRLVDSMAQHMSIWDNQGLRNTVCRTDFRFEDLKDGTATVYLILPFDQLKPYATYVQLFFSMALDAMLKNKNKPDIPVLFILDEFLRLEASHKIADAVDTHAGSGVRLWFFLQGLTKLEEIYPRSWKHMLKASVTTYFGIRDHHTAKEISETFGKTVVSYNTGGVSGGVGSDTSYSLQDDIAHTEKFLITPDQVVRDLADWTSFHDDKEKGPLTRSSLVQTQGLNIQGELVAWTGYRVFNDRRGWATDLLNQPPIKRAEPKPEPPKPDFEDTADQAKTAFQKAPSIQPEVWPEAEIPPSKVDLNKLEKELTSGHELDKSDHQIPSLNDIALEKLGNSILPFVLILGVGTATGVVVMMLICAVAMALTGPLALVGLPFLIGTTVIAFFVVPFIALASGSLFGRMAINKLQKMYAVQLLSEIHPLNIKVQEYAKRLGLPKIKYVGYYPSDELNAFATGVSKDHAMVCLSRALVEELPSEQVDAVICHELAHIVNGDMRRMSYAQGVQNSLTWFLFFNGAKRLARWFFTVISELAIMGLSRSREYRADAIGAVLVSPAAMASALQSIEAATKKPKTRPRDVDTLMFYSGFLGLFRTHPYTSDRIKAIKNLTYVNRLPRKDGTKSTVAYSYDNSNPLLKNGTYLEFIAVFSFILVPILSLLDEFWLKNATLNGLLSPFLFLSVDDYYLGLPDFGHPWWYYINGFIVMGLSQVTLFAFPAVMTLLGLQRRIDGKLNFRQGIGTALFSVGCWWGWWQIFNAMFVFTDYNFVTDNIEQILLGSTVFVLVLCVSGAFLARSGVRSASL